MAKNAQQFEERPWGTFEVIHEFQVTGQNGEAEDIVVKKLIVYPGKRLSYQSHKLRHETWSIVQGKGVAVLNDEEIVIEPGHVIHVPIGTKHRVINNHPEINLVAVEVGRGTFDEFDVERFEDDLGRI